MSEGGTQPVNVALRLAERARARKPIRVGLIGAGKFGAMFLSQALRTPGLHLVGVADLDLDRARRAFVSIGAAQGHPEAKSIGDALVTGRTFLTDDACALIAADGLEVIVEATGSPAAGIEHALACCQRQRHLVMVNVEADALAGPLLSRRAAEAGILYSLAYGDQPALIAELVDWARVSGFEIVCAGKGTKYLPAYHRSTPETVWGHYGFTPAQVAAGDFNAKMFNSFLDGTKSAIEMAAVANATGLDAPEDGLAFPPCGVDDLPTVLRPMADGGALKGSGMVEVVSSVERDGLAVSRDLRWGVFVTFRAPSEYVRRCFAEYGIRTDPSGWYGALYRPYHFIGLELGVSIANVALRGEATGTAQDFRADAAAVAKRDLAAGETLDGEGGYTVYGKLMPARASLADHALPIGLAHGLRLVKSVSAGEIVRWEDCSADESNLAVRVRREMELMFRPGLGLPDGGGS
jgi:predicted homoserine dehydrogenase-like protein